MGKVLVTGGTGFVGSHLVKKLLDEGRQVIVVSDFAQLGLENLTDLGILPSHIEISKLDLTQYEQALQAVKSVEVVFHLAAQVGSLTYLHGSDTAELAALQTNLLIDANVFRACLESGVKKLVYASSCAVYPMNKQFSPGAILSEDDLNLEHRTPEPIIFQSINPDGGYGWAKLIGEIQLSWMKNIAIGIARIFNVYGENEPLGERAHVIADLIQKAILYPQEDFIVRGDGTQSRDFLYISDCVDALLKLEAKASYPLITVNIGSGKAVSITKLTEEIIRVSGKEITPRYDPEKPVGPLSRTADITRAKTLLNWQPKIDLAEGIKRTYNWAKKQPFLTKSSFGNNH